MSDATPKPDDNEKKIVNKDQLASRIAGANLIQALKRSEENWLTQLEVINYQAKMLRAKYDAALAQGFSEQQALFFATQDWKF